VHSAGLEPATFSVRSLEKYVLGRLLEPSNSFI
jgi:hypothetical protein